MSDSAPSRERKAISSDTIRTLVSRERCRTLTQEEKIAVDEALLARQKRGGGKLSLFDIDAELGRLLSTRPKPTITAPDKKTLMKIFTKYFESHYTMAYMKKQEKAAAEEQARLSQQEESTDDKSQGSEIRY